MSLRTTAFALAICGVAFAVVSPSAYAQNQNALISLINRCSLGDWSACTQGSTLAILQRQQQIFSNLPAAGNGLYIPCVSREICGSIGGNVGNFSWTHQLFGDIRLNYPQVWSNLFPLSYLGRR
jgi:hypothetical protein